MTENNKDIRPHDELNLLKGVFPIHENAYGIPSMAPLAKEKVEGITKLIPFGARRRKYDGICHFFMDDYKFVSCWNKPAKHIPYLKKFPVVSTPDFSLFSDHPEVLQIYNTYRSRWLGRYYQEMGLDVIPTVSWSDSHSFEYCFEGLPNRSPLMVSTMGCIKDQYGRTFFDEGLLELVSLLNPDPLIVYGSKKYEDFTENTIIIPIDGDSMFLGEKEE